jgi:hypothetical protein
MRKVLVYGIALLFVLVACEQVDSGGANRLNDTAGKLFTITGSRPVT